MRNERTRISLKKHFHLLTFMGIVILAGAAVIVPVYSARSRSVSVSSPQKSALAANAPSVRTLSELSPKPIASSPAPPVFAQTIATFDGSDCSTPKTDFNLGEIVCVKVTGVPSSLFPWQVNWVGPYGLINESDSASIDDTTEYRYTIPTAATEVLNEQTVDHRGRWRVNLAKANGAIRQTAWFTVHEPANPQADIVVQKSQRDSNDLIHSGDNAAFVLVVQNAGPDTAANVHLVDSVPAGATLVSFNQDSGPTCTQGGASDCTIASLTNQDRAEFTVIYTITGAAGLYETSATASSDTPDQNTDNNSFTASYGIVSGSAGGTCELTCPSDVTATANTTEGGVRGAHVTFDDAVGTGTCGTITATPASGSFFPVGTTAVTATSATGNGECQFTVTVEEASGNVSISCPTNLVGNADANCQASFNLGNPTTTGDNVTITVSRSDGQPMYDCDVNGQNCVRKSTDLPFAAGTTTVTWTAYSHDTPGPYTSPDDEEAHRTGNASCTQTVTVNDVTPPTITATNQTVSADANCQAAIPDYTNAVVDNCACASSDQSQSCGDHPNITVTQDVAAGTLVGLGPHTITITANDGSSNNGGAGNTTIKTITFTVADTTPPTFTFVPPAVTAYTGSGATSCDTVISDATLGTATATDNCGPVTVTRSPSGNTFPVGTTTVTWTAADGANPANTTTATQTVTVIDNTPPMISCPASITLEPTCPSGAIATYTPPVGTDNCPNATTNRTAGLASGSVFPIGTTTVTYTVTDASGNSASCSFTVTVKTIAQTIQDMRAAVAALQPPLTGQQVQGLDAKLQAALDAVNSGKTNVACNKLADFINQVQAYLGNGTLTSAQGQPLINSATKLRNAIGCTNNPCT